MCVFEGANYLGECEVKAVGPRNGFGIGMGGNWKTFVDEPISITPEMGWRYEGERYAG